MKGQVKKAPRKKKEDKRPPLFKRYPTFGDPTETPAAEELYVRQKFALLTGSVVVSTDMKASSAAAAAEYNDDDLDFDLLDDAPPEPKEADEYTLTSFIRCQVYRCLYGQPISALPPPRENIDSPELCRDKRFVADAAVRSKRYIEQELTPHANRLYAHLEAALAWSPDVSRFHKGLRHKFGYQRSFITALDQPQSDLLLMAHAVYCFGLYVNDAVNETMDTIADKERTAMTLVAVWEFLCGGPRRAAQSVKLWDATSKDATPFVKKICQLRDVMSVTKQWGI